MKWSGNSFDSVLNACQNNEVVSKESESVNTGQEGESYITA